MRKWQAANGESELRAQPTPAQGECAAVGGRKGRASNLAAWKGDLLYAVASVLLCLCVCVCVVLCSCACEAASGVKPLASRCFFVRSLIGDYDCI